MPELNRGCNVTFNISLTSLALVLWSGMIIIAGSIWILSSQVRKLADIMEQQARVENERAREARRQADRTARELPRERVLRMVERTTSRVN
jgi:hypothetical protein